MNCRDAREALDALLDGELKRDEEAELRLHLEICASCERDFEELREWHGALSEALAMDIPEPPPAERRRTVNAVLAALRPKPVSLGSLAAVVAIGLSLGIVTCAVALSRPPAEQIARVVERMKERASRDAELRALDAEIGQDLGAAGRVVAGRDANDPAARTVAVASWNIARRLGPERIEEIRKTPAVDRVICDLQGAAPRGERVSISRTVGGATVSVTQMDDGRVCVSAPEGRFEARTMAELLARHADLCRTHAIAGDDGLLSVGDATAGADWKGRLELMFRTGRWDEKTQWETYRGWVAGTAPDPKEIERRVKEYQERCRASMAKGLSRALPATHVEALLKDAKSLSRAELQRTQERIESEMKKLDARLQEAAELRARARGLRVFAEEAARD